MLAGALTPFGTAAQVAREAARWIFYLTLSPASLVTGSLELTDDMTCGSKGNRVTNELIQQTRVLIIMIIGFRPHLNNMKTVQHITSTGRNLFYYLVLINDAPDLRVPLCCRHPIEACTGDGNKRQNVK